MSILRGGGLARYSLIIVALLLACAAIVASPAKKAFGQAVRIPTVTPTPVPQPKIPIAADTSDTSTTSAILERLHHHYIDTALANVRTVMGTRAVVPSPIYANGIYARDAFYATFGIEDLDLSEEAYRWFERAQDPQTGQIMTAVAFDPTDQSLQPKDDETTLLFVIWSGILHDNGRAVDMQVVQRAWRFVDSHVMSGRYVSPPGDFRYWADCWRLNRSNVITYNQGLYALAANFAQKMEVADVTDQTAADAVRQYRMLYRSDLGFLTQSAQGVGRAMQDVSALLPEFFYRYFFGDGMLPDRAVTSSVNHYTDTAAVRLSDGSLIGIKNIATATGAFADSGNFACPTLRQLGDYHNGGYWPMYTLAGLALAYKIDPKPEYRLAIEQLVARELADGRPKEYWMLSPGNEGMMQPGRADYSWNALVVPLFRWAGLID